MVLTGLLLGIIFTVAILYFFLVVLVLPTREPRIDLQQQSFAQQRFTSELRELSDLQALMERKQSQTIVANSWHENPDFLALRADIQSDSQAYRHIPGFLRVFMPKSWKKAWQYSESLTYVNDSIPKIISNWDSP